MNPTHNPPADVQPTPADILRAAARYLQLHGWYQGDLFNPTGPVAFPPACAIGAIYHAALGQPRTPAELPDHPSGPTVHRAVAVLADYLDRTLGIRPIKELAPDVTDTDVITGWNDITGRSATTIIATLHAAAADHGQATGGAQ